MSKIADVNRLLADVAKQKKLQGLKNEDIAEKTGYKVSSINSFTAGFRHSEKLANAVCVALNIKR